MLLILSGSFALNACTTHLQDEMENIKIGMTKEEVTLHCGVPSFENKYGMMYDGYMTKYELFFHNDTLTKITRTP